MTKFHVIKNLLFLKSACTQIDWHVNPELLQIILDHTQSRVKTTCSKPQIFPPSQNTGIYIHIYREVYQFLSVHQSNRHTAPVTFKLAYTDTNIMCMYLGTALVIPGRAVNVKNGSPQNPSLLLRL